MKLTEFMASAYFWSEAISCQYPFTTWCAKRWDSLWRHITRITGWLITRLMCIVSTRSSSWATLRTRSHGIFSLKRHSWLWMRAKLPLHSTKCTIVVTDLSLELQSIRYILRTAHCTSTKFNVFALRTNFCTHKSKWTSHCYSTSTQPLITTRAWLT